MRMCRCAVTREQKAAFKLVETLIPHVGVGLEVLRGIACDPTSPCYFSRQFTIIQDSLDLSAPSERMKDQVYAYLNIWIHYWGEPEQAPH